MQWDGALVRFGEIGIKSAPVRRRMLDRLQQNLLEGMVRSGVEGNVHRLGSRLWMVGPDADALAGVAKRTFGVVSVSPARRMEPDMDTIGVAAAEAALSGAPWTSFAVRASRDGDHPFSSQDVGIQVGSAIYRASEAAGGSPKVDLSNPDLEVYVEVRQTDAFVFLEKQPGPGGLPIGTQGKVVALLSDPASFVACWLIMRRGARVVPVHAGSTGSLPMENVEALQAWGLPDRIDLLPICTGFVSKKVLLGAAEELARRTGADAIVTGEDIGSELVVGQNEVAVLRPVCGLAPDFVRRYMDAIGLDEDEPEHILDAESHETVETALSMHRIVEL